VQTASTETARVSGTVTAGDVLTITAADPALPGGQQAINYSVQSGDSLSAIAANMAAAITSNANMQAAGINAVSTGSTIFVRSVSPNETTFATSTSGGATETLSFGIFANGNYNAVVTGTVSSGDILTVTVKDSALAGGQQSAGYTVQVGDTLSSIATGVKNAISADTNLQTLGVTATAASNVVNVRSSSSNTTNYQVSTSSGATASMSLAPNVNGRQRALVGGTITAADVVTLHVFDAALPSGTQAVNYSVQSGDTLASVASGLSTAVNGDSNLQAAGISASSTSSTITLNSNSTNVTSYRRSVSAAATETISLVAPLNGTETAAIGGTASSSDVLTITVHDGSLATGQQAINYSVQPGDTLTAVASGLSTAINANANLQAIGVTATSVSGVVNIKSDSSDLTTYSQSTSGGATETISLSQSTSVMQSTYNNVNALTSISSGGAARFKGTTTKPVKSVTVSSTPMELAWSQSFGGDSTLSAGNNNVAVQATDGGNNSKTNSYQIAVMAATSSAFSFDANGNVISDGTNTYEWDAEDRLVKINYPGSGNSTQFYFDGLSRNTKLEERTANSLTSTMQFVWCAARRSEERDASGIVAKQLFDRGQRNGGSSYYYSTDHLGSTLHMSDGFGNRVAEYNYSPWGERAVITETVRAEVAFASMYYHQRSGLNLAPFRTYSPSQGRWLSRDPLGEWAGVNMYAYVEANPINAIDVLGLTKNYPSGEWINAGGRAYWLPSGASGAGTRHIYRRHVLTPCLGSPPRGTLSYDAWDRLEKVLKMALTRPSAHTFEVINGQKWEYFRARLGVLKIDNNKIQHLPIGIDENGVPSRHVEVVIWMEGNTPVIVTVFPIADKGAKPLPGTPVR
jgi:RHS repeat-associated protein